MDETTSDKACAPAVLAEMTSELVAVYVSHNRVQPSDLPALIASVHAALANIGRSPEPAAAKPTRLMPIRKTVSDDHIVSLEDGRPYKALKRHLAKLGLAHSPTGRSGACRSTIPWWRRPMPVRVQPWPRRWAWAACVGVRRPDRSPQGPGRAGLLGSRRGGTSTWEAGEQARTAETSSFRRQGMTLWMMNSARNRV